MKVWERVGAKIKSKEFDIARVIEDNNKFYRKIRKAVRKLYPEYDMGRARS